MASTKKKRKTKHRGNALGAVEARGRTGRKPEQSASAGGRKSPADRSGPRPHRLDQPPTWRGSLARAAIASGVFFGVLVLFFKRPAAASAVVAVGMIAFYTPLGYFTDLWIHRRRKAKLDRGGASK